MSTRADAARREREESFRRLFVEHWASVRGRVASSLGDDEHTREDIDEIVNEVFLLAWKKWDRPQRITLRWLHVVTDNKVRDRRRRQTAWRRAMDAVHQNLVPDSSAVDELDRIALRHAFGKLNERERQALTLAYWGGWTAEEIAEHLKMTTSAVWAMLSRARAKLRDGVAEESQPPASTDAGVTTSRPIYQN